MSCTCPRVHGLSTPSPALAGEGGEGGATNTEQAAPPPGLPASGGGAHALRYGCYCRYSLVKYALSALTSEMPPVSLSRFRFACHSASVCQPIGRPGGALVVTTVASTWRSSTSGCSGTAMCFAIICAAAFGSAIASRYP